MHLVLYVFLFLCKKNHFCLNKWHKVRHFNEYHYMWCGSKFLLGEIMTQFQTKFPNTNYKNPRISSSIYLTITKKAISDNLSEDCSLNSPKLICVVIQVAQKYLKSTNRSLFQKPNNDSQRPSSKIHRLSTSCMNM